MTPQEKLALFKRLVDQANAEQAERPQYSHYFDEWQIGRVVKDMRMTLVSAGLGEIVLVKPTVGYNEPTEYFHGGHYRVAYLPAQPERGRNTGYCAQIAVDDIEIIG